MKAKTAIKLVVVLMGILWTAASLHAAPVNGPIYHRDLVLAGHTDTYRVVLRAGETTRIEVIGDGDTDLDLYLVDENGNRVDSDTDYTDDCIASVTPRWTGVFYVKIVNRGSVYNRYSMQIV